MVKIPNPEIPLCTTDFMSGHEILFLVELGLGKTLWLSGIATLL